jgi:membrane-bound lytic murein transglycosylase A
MALRLGVWGLTGGLGLALGLTSLALAGGALPSALKRTPPGPGTLAPPEVSPAPGPPPLVPVAATASAQLLQGLTLPENRQALLQAIDYSLDYLATPKAGADYADYPVAGVTRDLIWQSLQRLRQLVRTSPDSRALVQALGEEFLLYQAVGHDGEGTVAFTGYFEPYYRASAVPTAEYRYPLYRRPADLEDWDLPHPSRQDLEGTDGLQGSRGALAGLELVWLASRLEAFLVQVQGSAKLELTDGRVMSVGYAGRTDYPYTSIGQALVADGKIAPGNLSLPNLMAYFEAHPQSLDDYIPQNQRFIFFQETGGGAPTGNLSVPVTAGLSIATDKTLMPPGAMALIQVPLPQPGPGGDWSPQDTTRLVLDQDTGGAIVGPGRVDIFVGSGPAAGELAGRINTQGQLYYLLLRPTP